MMYKHPLFYFSFLLLCMNFTTGCDSSNNQKRDKINIVRIEGEVETTLDKVVKVEVIKNGKKMIIDSFSINEDNHFFGEISVKEANFFILNFSDIQKILLILTGDEGKISIKAKGNNENGFAEVKGSKATEYAIKMDEITRKFTDYIQTIRPEINEAQQQGDAQTVRNLQEEINAKIEASQSKLKELIQEASPSLASVYGIQLLGIEDHTTFIKKILEDVSKQHPTNELLVQLQKTIKSDMALAVGSVAPEIALPNPAGEIITLSSLKGNYVLIDFWAAWCKPCRTENPHVVNLYNQYSNKNFEILGVSLDRTKEAWVKAIKQDKLPWKHVSDLKFWSSEPAKEYQVSAIPATYLIDPEGNILAKNLRGESLRKKLASIFGNKS